MSNDFPSDKTLNATLTFFISLDVASMSNLWLLFRYLVCHILMLAIILSLFLSTCLTHQLKAGAKSISCVTANSAVCTRCDSFNSDNFSHEVEPSFYWQHICQPTVVFCVTGLPHTVICWSDRDMALLSF